MPYPAYGSAIVVGLIRATASHQALIAGCGTSALSGLGSATVVGLIRRDSVASGIDSGCGASALSGLQVVHPTTPNNRNTEHAKHNPVLVCPGNDQATTDAWLKGWDERNGGNLTRAWMTPISHHITTIFTNNRAYPAQPAHAFTGKYTVYCHRLGKFFRNVQLDPAANLGIVKATATARATTFFGG